MISATVLDSNVLVSALGWRGTYHAVYELCRRGASEIPLHPDFVGLRLDVGGANVVEIHAHPYEDEWGVRLLRREDVGDG